MLRMLLTLLLLALPCASWAAKQVALVIGNDAYTEVSKLQKAVADAEAVAARMTAAGYQTILRTDVGRRETNLAISRFTASLEPGDTAFVFYAGHGVQIDGENYLLPTDIAAPEGVSEGFITAESIPLSGLLDRIRRTGARTTLAIVDACRNNPFTEKNGRSIGGTRGLARVAAPEGTFVVFSAGAGQQALDRLSEDDTDPNSVFTRALLPRLDQEGLELRDMVFGLREEVRDLALSRNHQQFPAYYDELLGDFYILPNGGPEPETLAAEPQPLPQDTGDIRADFELARGLGTRSAYARFIETYEDHPDQFVVSLARDLMAGIGGEPQPIAPQPEPEEPREDTRAILRVTQQELNRLGCNAGGADGIAGRRTRNAFDAFVTASGAALTAGDLGTEKALGVLKSATRRCPEPAPLPEPPHLETGGVTLLGTWTYVAHCPFFISAKGTVRYRQTGADSYAGSWHDSLGNQGTATAHLDGRKYSAAVRWPGRRASENGTIAPDGQSYSGRNSLGCKLTGARVN